MDEAFLRQVKQALVLEGHFKHPSIFWRNSTVGHKQSRNFMESSGDKFHAQVIQEPRRGALLDLVHTNKDVLFGI